MLTWLCPTFPAGGGHPTLSTPHRRAAPKRVRPAGSAPRYLEISSADTRITFAHLLAGCLRTHLKGLRPENTAATF